MWPDVLHSYYSDPPTAVIVASVGLCVLLVLILIFRWARKPAAKEQMKKVKQFVNPGMGPRFRKRDRLEFMSRRVLRNAKAVGSYIRGGQGRKRKDMARIMRKMFHAQGSPDSQSQMLRPDMPEDFLEEDRGQSEEELGGGLLPDSLVLVFKNLRVFGHVDNSILLEVMKNMETVHLKVSIG